MQLKQYRERNINAYTKEEERSPINDLGFILSEEEKRKIKYKKGNNKEKRENQ